MGFDAWIFCSGGGHDDHYATPPKHGQYLLMHELCKVAFLKRHKSLAILFYSNHLQVLFLVQGDQNGLIFAFWTIKYLVSFFRKLQKKTKILGPIFHAKMCVLILMKNGLGGYILGDFFSQTHLVTLFLCPIFVKNLRGGNVWLPLLHFLGASVKLAF
jgi:hypothetical protein